MTEDFMKAEVRVFCPTCQKGHNAIWHGLLIEWSIQLSRNDIPDWAKYAANHEKEHGHRIMVQYPNRVVPWRSEP